MELVISSLPAFLLGLVLGVVAMAIFNKLRGGAANPATTKDAFDQYKVDVAEHFTETGKKFQSMASHYQDLYEHLAVGAHTLLDNETATKMLAPPEQSKSADKSSDKSSDKGNTKAEAVAKAQVKASAGSTMTKPADNTAVNKSGSLASNSKGSAAKASNSSSSSASTAKTSEKKPTQNQSKKK